jgi:hypothetical protein
MRPLPSAYEGMSLIWSMKEIANVYACARYRHVFPLYQTRSIIHAEYFENINFNCSAAKERQDEGVYTHSYAIRPEEKNQTMKSNEPAQCHKCGSLPVDQSSTGLKSMRRRELIDHVTIMIQSNKDLEAKVEAAEDNAAKLQNDFVALQKEFEDLCQAFRRERNDKLHHQEYYNKLVQATEETTSKINEIREEYGRTVDINMFSEDMIITLQ